MQYLETLKKIVFVADRLQKFSDFNFFNEKIKVNTLLENSKVLIYAFNVLEIPYESFTPENEDISSPDEINITVGREVDLKVLYYLTFVAKEIFNDFDIYIIYASEPQGREHDVCFGTYLTRDEEFTNISRPINPNEITILNIETIDWEHFSTLFPNENYLDDGRLTYTNEEENDDYDDYYDGRDYHDYDRDTFDALTDGQYGDYDSWREGGGDLDSLRDGLGY